MNIWLVSREYAGIAEAGGVKNVACSLAESLSRLGHHVSVFIPLYGCTDLSHIENFSDKWRSSVSFEICGNPVEVSFSHGILNSVEIILVCHQSFLEKKAVYTYTAEEQKANPAHRQGEGHADRDFLNMLFQKAVVFYSENCAKPERPDIVHSQDAPASMVSVFARFFPAVSEFFSDTKFVVTVHNAGPGYHHEFKDLSAAERFSGLPAKILEKGKNRHCIEPFLLAAETACITTVSPEYACEIISGRTDTAGLSQEFRKKGIELVGITNGIDFFKYDPADVHKSLLPFSFNPLKNDLDGKYKCRDFFLEHFASEKSLASGKFERGTVQYGFIDTRGDNTGFVYIAYHGRVVQQKGIEVMLEAAEKLLADKVPVKFVFAGQGSLELENSLIRFSDRWKGSCVYIKGYSKSLSRLALASVDFSLHPSYFEPCGLEDFIAQTFGTLPVAHATGGLCKIVDDETGWLYAPNTASALRTVLESLVCIMHCAGRDIFKAMISYASRYIHEHYSWNRVGLEYENLYKKLLKG
ncbi:glycogen synthase [Treponema sp.]|uniref:glycogen synthase n=1 Tax=Treponema sp. TaxID=166 RepID=UPI003F0495CA